MGASITRETEASHPQSTLAVWQGQARTIPFLRRDALLVFLFHLSRHPDL